MVMGYVLVVLDFWSHTHTHTPFVINDKISKIAFNLCTLSLLNECMLHDKIKTLATDEVRPASSIQCISAIEINEHFG